MTIALAIVYVALLMIYCGVKGRSLKHALTGRSVLGGDGQLLADATQTTAGQTGSTGNAAPQGKPGTSGASRGEGGPHR